ncbi:interferon-induced 35 kDa protein [Gallus gallus]|uniref:Interferon induced protein 35 n=1 Tax=Gallus gallus TaxID=9031 RepID=A0A8V0ZNC1_CHICK|nr:interferon-induced 35 kDa protein [Gallus gallus]|eukprot:XP_418132.1 interferon-induced 35 kDa protein isoform X3 [Gallus gallus]
MDSEEDSFVRLASPQQREDCSPEMSPERARQEIEQYKDLCRALDQDNAMLQKDKEAVEQRLQHVKKERELLQKNLKQKPPKDEKVSLQVDISIAQDEKSRLTQEKQMLENKLEEMRKRILWEDPMMMLRTLPERKVVFKGLTTDKENMDKLVLTPLVRYPLSGGSALITFEKAEVAQRVIEMKEHVVELSHGEDPEDLDRCQVRVQAGPVDILLPSALEIGLTRGSRSILVSGLPSLGIPEDILLDKLELFFSKTKNGGSEVESREFLDDCGQVVLTFTQDGVAEQLITRGQVQVPIGKTKYKLKISPYMSGDVTNLQLQPSHCTRTVLLSGIPDVLAEEPMRDALEIHFQKDSRGGGEVDVLGYVPAGRWAVAVFREDMGQP